MSELLVCGIFVNFEASWIYRRKWEKYVSKILLWMLHWSYIRLKCCSLLISCKMSKIFEKNVSMNQSFMGFASMMQSTPYTYFEFDNIFRWNVAMNHSFLIYSSLMCSWPYLAYEVSKVLQYIVGLSCLFAVCSSIIWLPFNPSNQLSNRLA